MKAAAATAAFFVFDVYALFGVTCSEKTKKPAVRRVFDGSTGLPSFEPWETPVIGDVSEFVLIV